MKKPGKSRHAVKPESGDSEKYNPNVVITPVMRCLMRWIGDSDYLIQGQEYKMTLQALIYNPAKEAIGKFAVFSTDAYPPNVQKVNGFYYRTFQTLTELLEEWELVESLGQFWQKPREATKGQKSIDKLVEVENQESAGEKTLDDWYTEIRTIWQKRLDDYLVLNGEK